MDPSTLSVFLALGAAAGAGFADYLAAHASRRRPAITVAAWIQSIGLAVVLVALAFGGPPAIGGRDALVAVLSGLSIAVGIAALYRSLAIGPIGVTAPTAAVTGAALPVVVSVAHGDVLAGSQYLGLAVGIVGVALFASSPAGGPSGDKWLGLAFALLAGAGIGGFTIGLESVDPAAGMWPLVIMRTVATIGLWLVALRAPRTGEPGTGGRARLIAAGLLDGAAMVSFAAALQAGHMAVVAVIAALYPAFTVALAIAIDRERLRAPQAVGLAFAAVAVVLISGAG